MKRIKSNININRLFHPLSESAQQSVSGGAIHLEVYGIQGESTESTISGAQIRVPIKVKHNV